MMVAMMAPTNKISPAIKMPDAIVCRFWQRNHLGQENFVSEEDLYCLSQMSRYIYIYRGDSKVLILGGDSLNSPCT